MVDCACSGIRHCLLCESKNDGKTLATDLNHEDKLKTLMFCIKCQKLCLGKENICPNTCTEHDYFKDNVVSGITVIKDFITKKEEEFMVGEIKKFPWQVSQSGRLKQVGILFCSASPPGHSRPNSMGKQLNWQ